MVTPELVTYVKNQSALGQSKENIKNILLANGWPELDVSEAIRQVFGGVSQDAGVINSAPGPGAVVEPLKPEPIIETVQSKPMSSPASQEPVINVAVAPPAANEVKPEPVLVVGNTQPQPETPVVAKPVEAKPVSPLPVSQPAVVSSISSTASRQTKFFLKGNDWLKIGLGVLVGLVIGIGLSAGWGAIRKILLKSPIVSPIPSPSLSPIPSLSPTPLSRQFIPYTNGQYSFSIGYPDDWYVSENASPNSIVSFSEKETGGANVNIGGGTTTPTMTVDSLINATNGELKKVYADYLVQNTSTITIGSVSARLVEVTFSAGGVKAKQRYLYIFPKAGNYLVIIATSGEESWTAYNQVFNQMFGSFRLL